VHFRDPHTLGARIFHLLLLALLQGPVLEMLSVEIQKQHLLSQDSSATS
jgi:hypothetical protein